MAANDTVERQAGALPSIEVDLSQSSTAPNISGLHFCINTK
jgi:hypothetical protein